MKTTRPWGTYEVIRQNNLENFLLKKIVVNPNSRLSLQSHEHRSEHWVVVQGQGVVVVGEDSVVCALNTHVFIPRGAKHRMQNTSKEFYSTILDHIGEQRDKFAVKPFIANTTKEEQEKGAPETFEVPITFDQSNFFV